ncbi:hypothetical protein IM792_17190 [Mucilaginibacter sp. JRF]|uniref:hypothetical protein n=1 Tax=Mucilaginibacter sp. JRF TaxID=2780088 RepID=UPI001881FF6E|nr:hypothetical protein [Mucilaginibacter sp. JRF]MBE9586193.1 hypothetical protein [Mucilaginibacter sp. JRF]
MLQFETGVQHQQTQSKFTKKINKFALLAIIATTTIFASCKKDQVEAPASEGLKLNTETALAPNPGSSLNLTNATGTVGQSSTGAIYTVTNYFVDQGLYTHPDSVYHRPNGTYYFDFSLNDNKKGATTTTPPSNGVWDISFSSTANAYLNKNTSSGNVSDIRYVNEPFSTVKGYAASVWNDTALPSGKAKLIATYPFGHNNIVYSDVYTNQGGVSGWFNYYFTNHQVNPLTDRTVLVKDAADNVYAVHFINVYKNGAPYEPGDNTANPPADYSWLKFEYKKLGTL